jgi:hypothetical protein
MCRPRQRFEFTLNQVVLHAPPANLCRHPHKIPLNFVDIREGKRLAPGLFHQPFRVIDAARRKRAVGNLLNLA